MKPMSEKTKQILKELLRSVVAALVAAITAFFSTSCGSTTRAVIHNRAEGTETAVSITTNNPSTINVDPNTTIDLFKRKKDVEN